MALSFVLFCFFKKKEIALFGKELYLQYVMFFCRGWPGAYQCINLWHLIATLSLDSRLLRQILKDHRLWSLHFFLIQETSSSIMSG